MKLFLQAQKSECGLACLAMLAHFHGHRTDLTQLRRRFPVSAKGMALAQLLSCASALGFTARAVRAELEAIGSLALPCILHWDLNHFVVLRRLTRRGAEVLDPAAGLRRMPLREVSRHFSGVAVECMPGPAFEPVDATPRLRLSSLTGKVIGLERALAKVLAVSLAVQLFALAAPLLNQLVIDEVVASHDADLLTVLVAGFGLLLVAQTLLGLARSWMVMVLGQTLSLQWSANVFARLVALPLAWFEQRHVGDIASRFGSVAAIQRLVTTRSVEALLDGVMALAALAMMIAYASSLALVTAGAVLAYLLVRAALYAPLREAAAERLVLAAREQSHFLETIRAIAPVKLFAKEDERRAQWQNLVVEVHNRDVRSTRLGIAFSAASTLIFGVENLLMFWLGARLIMDGQAAQHVAFTAGMLFAYASYKTQFVQRVTALVDFGIELKMLALHAERLADIVLTEPERCTAPESDLAHLPASIELRGVSFRYAEGEPWVLKDANLVVAPGEHVAIVGRSGCGKSTLLKILLGVLPPTEGEVLYGGVPAQRLGLANVRRRIGTVMQDDALLSGSLADNIAFFDVAAPLASIESAARMAQVHDEIVRMPLAYETMVGDLGAGLSGGQRQRLLLARALFKKPSVLVLDEATSHLDLHNERAVGAALAQLDLTRIVVAHRPETIANAQRVVLLQQGQLRELLPTESAGRESARAGVDASGEASLQRKGHP